MINQENLKLKSIESEKAMVFAALIALRSYIGGVFSIHDLWCELKDQLKENDIYYYIDGFRRDGVISRVSRDMIEFD